MHNTMDAIFDNITYRNANKKTQRILPEEINYDFLKLEATTNKYLKQKHGQNFERISLNTYKEVDYDHEAFYSNFIEQEKKKYLSKKN